MCGTSQVNPSSPVYKLSCSVCKEQFSGRNSWLRHLTQDSHQKLARLECLEKWDSELRKCCMLLFTSTNLTAETAEEIVKYFSNHFNEDKAALVTDFVWWADRPQLGILQFESRGKVKDVLTAVGSNGSSKIVIGSSQSLQVRAGSKLMEFEWQAILPQKSSTVKPSRKGSSKAALNNVRKASSVEPEMEGQNHNRTSKRVKLDESFDKSIIKSKDVCISSPQSPPNILHSDQPLPPSMTSTSHPLQSEYWAIRKAILIPDNQYNQAMEAFSSLKNILTKQVPNLKVNLFRNWYLKLKLPKYQPDLLLFAYTPDDISTDLLRQLTGIRHSLRSSSFKLFRRQKKKSDDILMMNYLPTNLKVSLLTPKVPGSLREFQVCRMLEYLCQFDPRCQSLITLACYWATLNSINLSSGEPQSPLELPPHYTIQWLVIFFMAKGKYIPSPRQIQKESFSKDLTLKDDISGTSIGFSWNPDSIQFWRKSKERGRNKDFCNLVDENSEEFLLSLLQLFDKFLNFCQAVLGCHRNLILHTGDGMLIDINYLNYADATDGNERQGKRYQPWMSVVSKEDITELKKAVETEKRVKGKCEIYMTHPFLASQKFSLSNDIKVMFRELYVRDRKMDAFLKHVKNFGVPAALAKWNSLKDVLTN